MGSIENPYKLQIDACSRSDRKHAPCLLACTTSLGLVSVDPLSFVIMLGKYKGVIGNPTLKAFGLGYV